ncbi:MAG: hypothetical protein PHQ65_15690 [Bacteroidales bacterium]|nr:hypothetical protein [Bacteroidales bacterium]MDD3666708.1 hypothetical protein [Bacteroidales bacterium]
MAITPKNGQFRFNQAAVKLMGLSEAKKVEFLKDSDSGQVYCSVMTGGKGFVLKSKNNVLCFNSKTLCRILWPEILDKLSYKSIRFIFPGSSDTSHGEALWPLLNV